MIKGSGWNNTKYAYIQRQSILIHKPKINTSKGRKRWQCSNNRKPQYISFNITTIIITIKTENQYRNSELGQHYTPRWLNRHTYRTVQLKADYTFFSGLRTFSGNIMLGNKTNFNKFKNSEIILRIFWPQWYENTNQ
jgi:hypothetical protein